MSKLVANYSGGASDEYGTFKSLNEAFTGQVFKGLDTAPNATPNMTVKVNPGSGRIPTGTVPSDYYYMISHDTVGGESVTIATAAASPRIDYVVAYVDKGVTPSLTPVNNTNNLLKFAAVAGTPAGSPVVPTVAQIQTAIGAANPYIILSQIAVAASVTTITTPNITDTRTFAKIQGSNVASPAGRVYQDQANQSFSTGVSAQVTGANTTFITSGGKVFVAFSANQVYTGAGTAIFQLFIDGVYSVDVAAVSPGTGASKGGAVGFVITSPLIAASHSFSIQLLNSSGASQLLQYNTYSFVAFEIGR